MRSDRREETSGPVRRSKCLRRARSAFRAARRAAVAAGSAGWAAGARDRGEQWEDGYPKCQCPSLSSTCSLLVEGVDRRVGGWANWEPRRREFEKLWSTILFPKEYPRDFSPWDFYLGSIGPEFRCGIENSAALILG